MQSPQQQTGSFNIRTLLFIHFIICSIGLLGVVDNVARLIGPAVFSPINVFISYTDWAIYSFTPTKPVELLQYGLSVPALALYYWGVLLFIRKCGGLAGAVLERIAPTRLVLMGYFGLLVLLNLALLRVHGKFAPILVMFWLISLALPTLPSVSSWFDCVGRKNGLWATITVFLVLIASLGFVFYPYVTGGLPVSNDYMDVPEQTILSTGVVDNTDYINKNNIGGLHKHDPRVLSSQSSVLPQTGAFIKLKKNAELLGFVSAHANLFIYDEINSVLVVTGVMTERDADNLARVVADEAERRLVYDFYYKKLSEFKIKKNYSPEQIEFVRRNAYEFQDQSLAGHYFHHQNTILGTINEYVLGKPQSQTVFLYGWLSTVVIAEAMKAVGDINFENYQRVFYSFYPAYYLLLLVAAAIIFKKKEYVLLVGIVSIGALYSVGFETTRFAPGFNPIRHFFDIFVLVFFYWYLFKPSRNLLYFFLTLVFSIIGILFNKEFGLALLLSIVLTTFVRAAAERKKILAESALIVVAVLISIASFVLISTGKNPTLLYVLLGVAAPTAHWMKIYGLLILFSAIYVLLIKNRKSGNGWCYLALLWFLYAQGLLIYYIWNPAPNHLWSLGSVWGMSLVLLLQYAVSNYDWMVQYEKKILLISNIALVFSLLLPSIVFYYQDQSAYQKVFKEHVLHHWDLPRAKFVSTMDPAVFKNAVELIDKYSRSNSIYILSKYDNFLPFLAAKYSAMPYTEVALSLVTQKEMDASVRVIIQNRPEYLFADSDMMRNHAGDIFKGGDPVTKYLDVYDASKGRAMVLDNFAKIFKEVSPLYEPVEVGQLITVYKRRVGA